MMTEFFGSLLYEVIFYAGLFITIEYFFSGFMAKIKDENKNSIKKNKTKGKLRANNNESEIYDDNIKRVIERITEQAIMFEIPLNSSLGKQRDRFKIDASGRLIKKSLQIAFSYDALKEKDLMKRKLTENEVDFVCLMVCIKCSSLNSSSVDSIKINSYVSTSKNTPYTLAIVQRLYFLIAISLLGKLKGEGYSKIANNPGYYDKLLDRSLYNINKL